MIILERDLGNAKLQELVNTAIRLFWKFGFQRVSIEELCREAGVSKMTFYKHFNNKIDLVKFILLEMTTQTYKKYNSIMEKDVPFEEKVKQTIDLKMEQTEKMSEEFFRDVYAFDDPELHDFVQTHLGKWIKKIHESFLEAQKKGDIRRDLKPEFIVYFLNHMSEMMNDEHMKKLYSNPQEQIRELMNFFFYGILPVRETNQP
jgi:AcrR family transcriptional regulator